MRLSVMIPAYKAVDTLDRCLNSILCQLPSDSEVILVEDGSPDGTGAVCDRWAERDARVRVFHQPNGGASAARNRALQEATGDYLQFVDADDELLPGLYSAVLPELENGAELCFFGCLYEGRTPLQFDLHPVHRIHWQQLGQEEIQRYLFTTELFSHPINKIFTRSLWEGSGAVFDTALPVNEDIKFNFALFPHCSLFSILPQAYYLVHADSAESLSRCFRTDLCRCAAQVLPGLNQFLQVCGININEAALLTERYRLNAVCNQYGILVARPGPYKERRAALRELLGDRIGRRAILELLRRDPNRLLALPLRFCVALNLPSLLAGLFQLRIAARN